VPWIVALTKPNHEAIAADNLRRQAFDYYYPRFLFKKPGSTSTIRPLFPRYMFIHIGQMWRSLSGTRGISYLLMGEFGPQKVSDRIVESLKARHDSAGLYQLVEPPKFNRGAKVKVETGPFAGCPLIYEGMIAADRVACLVEAMGRKIPIELKESALVAA
jgi:transcription antitermination factor NusG